MLRKIALSALLLLTGCNDEPCGERSPCPKFTVSPGGNDGEVRWGDANSMVLELSGRRASRDLEGGGAVFTAADSQCVRDCRITLRTLFFELGRVVLESDDYDDVVVDHLRIGFDTSAPVELQGEGTGYVLPEGTRLQTCSTIDGESVLSRSELDAPVVLAIDPLNGVFLVNGNFPVRVSAVVDGECVQFPMRAGGDVSAEMPWLENPLCAGLESCSLEAGEP